MKEVPGHGRADHLPSAPRSRARAVVVIAAAMAAVALGMLGERPAPRADAVAPTTTIAPTVTTTTIAPAATTTTAGAVTTTTTAAIPIRRGGAEAGSIAKPEDEAWSVRQMVTTTAVCIAALAAAGFIYGRIRSAPPRHPDLVHEPD